MKKIFIYIFFIFIFINFKNSFANDILVSDKGIKIGDSALKYFDKDLIESKKRLIYPKDNYFMIFVDGAQINIKNNDPNYTIGSIDDGRFIKFNECQILMENQIKKYKKLFPKAEQSQRGSLLVGFDFFLNGHPSKGPAIRIECTDWSNEIETTKNWQDNFTKSINSKEFNLFLLSMS